MIRAFVFPRAFPLNRQHPVSRRLFNSTVKLLQANNEIGAPKARSVKTPRGSLNTAKNLRRSFLPNKKGTPSQTAINNANTNKLAYFLKTKSCTTITTSESYDLNKVISSLNASGYHAVSLVPDEIVTFKYFYNGCHSDVMVLGNSGTVVAWGLEESFVFENILPLIENGRVNPLTEECMESEDLDFLQVENAEDLEKVRQITNRSASESFVEGDLIIVNSIDPNLGLLDKAAFSSGMSRSTRLAVLEHLLEAHIEKSRKFTELLSQGKKLSLTESDVLQSTGSLFLIRGKLNLYSELIETPDLYWSEPQLERIYKQMSRSLDIQPRISILNTKLDYAAEESRAFMAVLNEKKSTHLEWIIIYLITVEVCFELHHYYERYWLDSTESCVRPTS
ncbi:LAQU0S11e02432g1_1 [Lachancea quebecensis]|uniref:LAQU0S11e02432g1_1 n=1 Tax=Lachancea quebecensis TaxID=1654605 RepID=A0A0P1KUU2_9SACH|nr:LAQU0S11e02432g1_1 [Lachancea quebecensis]